MTKKKGNKLYDQVFIISTLYLRNSIFLKYENSLCKAIFFKGEGMCNFQLNYGTNGHAITRRINGI